MSAHLTLNQQQGLLLSWKLIKPTFQGITRKILNDLESALPNVKQIFCKAAVLEAFSRESNNESRFTLEDHVRMLVSFFDELVTNIVDEDEVVKIARRVGHEHEVLTQCQFTADIWEIFGETAVTSLCSVDPVQKVREAGRAWRILIAWITDELRCGFETQARAVSRSTIITP